MVTTRIASEARSRAIGNVMPTTPPFDAEYAAWPIWPSKAATDAVFTMTPRSSPSSAFSAIAVAANRITLNVPIRFTEITFEKASSGNAPFLPVVLIALPMPAQFTTIARVPSSLARSTAACTAASSVTSAGAKRTASPRAASAEVSALGRSIATTRAPPATRRVTVARPRPEAPPVTSAVLFFRSITVSSPSRHPSK